MSTGEVDEAYVTSLYAPRAVKKTWHPIGTDILARGVVIASPNNEALRYNKGKAQMWYNVLWPRADEAFARVCEYGGRKYTELNFTKGGKPAEEYMSAALRHIYQHCKYYITKDEANMYDKESGCLHISHAIWNLKMLVDYVHDDVPLYKPGGIKEWQK